MGDLLISRTNPITDNIWEYWRKQGESETPRRYLGISSIGHECDRFLWLNFRGVVIPKFEPRMYRLFNRGHREENVFIQELRGIGCNVWEVNPSTKEQWSVSLLGGHFRGHLDGVATGVPGAPKTAHVLEFKTHNDSNFKQLVKNGVKDSHVRHWIQMNTYMGAMKLTRALYIGVNKNTDDIHPERVRFEKEVYEATCKRAERIITSHDAVRCSERSDDWRCKYCYAREVCWGEVNTAALIDAKAIIDCRSCCHASPKIRDSSGGQWSCLKNQAVIIGQQNKCKYHRLLPSLVRAKAVNSDGDNVVYETDNGTFINGDLPGGYTSIELAETPLSIVEDNNIKVAKELFKAEITEVVLPQIYNAGDNEVLWKGNKKDLTTFLSTLPPLELTCQYKDRGAEFYEYNSAYLVGIKDDLAYVIKGKE